MVYICFMPSHTTARTYHPGTCGIHWQRECFAFLGITAIFISFEPPRSRLPLTSAQVPHGTSFMVDHWRLQQNGGRPTAVQPWWLCRETIPPYIIFISVCNVRKAKSIFHAKSIFSKGLRIDERNWSMYWFGYFKFNIVAFLFIVQSDDSREYMRICEVTFWRCCKSEHSNKVIHSGIWLSF